MKNAAYDSLGKGIIDGINYQAMGENPATFPGAGTISRRGTGSDEPLGGK